MALPRVTHKHVQQACERYNERLKLTKRNSIGRIQWADIRGDGAGYRPGLYAVVNDNGGVGQSDIRRSGQTLRQLVQAIDAAVKFDRLRDFAVIIQAIHERGEVQRMALRELNRRGLWLSADQRAQAGLVA